MQKSGKQHIKQRAVFKARDHSQKVKEKTGRRSFISTDQGRKDVEAKKAKEGQSNLGGKKLTNRKQTTRKKSLGSNVDA